MFFLLFPLSGSPPGFFSNQQALFEILPCAPLWARHSGGHREKQKRSCNPCLQGGGLYSRWEVPTLLLPCSPAQEDALHCFFQPRELSGKSKCFCENCGKKTCGKQVHSPPNQILAPCEISGRLFPEPPGQLMTADGGILVRLDPDLMGSWDSSDHIKRRAEPFKGRKRRSKIRGQSFSPQGYTSSLEQIPLLTWVPGPV